MLHRCRILLLLFSVFVAINAASIEKGWEDVFGDSHSTTLPIQVFGNKSYLVVTSYKLNFLQAMDFCENLHMNLVTIESAEQNQIVQKFVTDTSSGSEYWAAGSNLLDGKTWLWLTTGDVFGFTAWAPNEPSSGNEYCLSVKKSGDSALWNNLNCDWELPFICERPLDERREDIFAAEEKDWQNILNVHAETPNLDLLHFQGKDYYISHDYKGNYYEALDYCEALNMKLVSIDSKEENTKLYNRIRDTNAGSDFWSSGSRLLDGRNWLWLSKGQPIGYTNWAPNEPNNVNDACLHLVFNKNKDLYWDDTNCNNVYKVICEGNSNDNGWNNEFDNDYAENEDEEFLNDLKKLVPGNIPTINHEGRVFYISRNLLATPSQARLFCAHHNLKLADIKSAEENSLIAQILPYPVSDGPYWIDGQHENGKWLWKSDDSPISYFNWHLGSPKSQEDVCLGVTTHGQFQDECCKKKKPFICESASDEDHNGKDDREAIINVFIANNLITKDGKITKAQEFISSQNIEAQSNGGYHITVDNNAVKC